MASYLKKEISEWNTTDLCKWLIDNKYPGISELCQNNSLSGYDLFFINEDILKNELGLSSFHERKVTMKLINKLIYEHLKLNIINSNGDNVILTLDNNQNTSLGELSEYIGGMFNINPKDILYKDNSKTEVLSPTLKIIKLLILYPRLYKTLNVFNMKDYHQPSDNENIESKNVLNNNSVGDAGDGAGSENESDYQKSNLINNNMNIKMNYDYNVNKANKMESEKEKIVMDNYNSNENNPNPYNFEQNRKNRIINNDDFDIKNQKYKNVIRRDRNENIKNENIEENDNEIDDNNWDLNNDLNYRIQTNYRDNENIGNNNMVKGYSSLRNRKNMNFNNKSYQDNYMNNKTYKNLENRDNYYNNDIN